MRAIVYRGAGDANVIGLEERPDPAPGPGQVRVRVAAAGLNRADVIQRRGAYPAPPGWPPDIPGLEFAGRVESLGVGAERWPIGARVMGLVGGGAHAEFVVTHQDELLAIPEPLSDAEAAAIPEAFLTAYDALAIRGRLAPKERVLIHAVGSGVSTAAVQLARWMDATVVGVSRTASKLDQARPLGLSETVLLGPNGFRGELAAPVDVILDYLGGPAFSENLSALNIRGRLVLLGTLQGPEAPAVSVAMILRSRFEVIGTVMRTRPHPERVALVAEFAARVLPLIRPGGVGPVIGARFPMTDLAAAHAAMEHNGVFGKIVLEW